MENDLIPLSRTVPLLLRFAFTATLRSILDRAPATPYHFPPNHFLRPFFFPLSLLPFSFSLRFVYPQRLRLRGGYPGVLISTNGSAFLTPSRTLRVEPVAARHTLAFRFSDFASGTVHERYTVTLQSRQGSEGTSACETAKHPLRFGLSRHRD